VFALITIGCYFKSFRIFGDWLYLWISWWILWFSNEYFIQSKKK